MWIILIIASAIGGIVRHTFRWLTFGFFRIFTNTIKDIKRCYQDYGPNSLKRMVERTNFSTDVRRINDAGQPQKHGTHKRHRRGHRGGRKHHKHN